MSLKSKIKEQIQLHKALLQAPYSDDSITDFWMSKIIHQSKIESLEWVLQELENERRA